MFTQTTQTTNSTARQVAQAAGLLTVLYDRAQRGAELLADGYTLNRTKVPSIYMVDTPEGNAYDMIFDQSVGFAACSCPDCKYRRIPCKHLAALAINKEMIDAQRPVITIRAYTRTTKAGRMVRIASHRRRLPLAISAVDNQRNIP